MTPKNDIIYDVVGIGNAIVDVLAKVGDGFLTERHLDKGAMTLLQAAEAGTIYADLIPEREVSGGSAANTVAAIASLGGTPAFIGKVHDDELGQEFQRSIGAAGVDFFTKPLLQGPSTGRSIVLVTPDAERSMFTYLGAAQKLSADDVDENIIKSSKIIYLEGYIWDSESAREAMLKACEIAHKYDRMIAFSLSDRCCIDRHRADFQKLIHDHVDIIFGNEGLLELYKKIRPGEPLSVDSAESLLNSMFFDPRRYDLAKVGRYKFNKKLAFKNRIKGHTLAEDVVDTTGAGDLYAAGFLYGYTQGRSLGTCAMIGGIAAAEIISHYGARAEVSLRGFARNRLRAYGKSFS